MVQLALALASAVLALPTLTSLGVQAAPLPSAQQNDMNVIQNGDSLVSLNDMPLPLRVRRADVGYQRRTPAPSKRSRQRIVWDEDGVQSAAEFANPRQQVPSFIRRRSTSGQGRGHVQEGGGMDTPGGSMQGGVSASSKRDGAVSGVPGAINIVAVNSTNTTTSNAAQQAFASLLFSAESASRPLKGTASATNHTTIYLAAAPSNVTLAAVANSTAPVDDVLVNLKMAVFDMDRAQLVEYCATYDPAPAGASSMDAAPCTASSSEHVSQLFAYTPATGFIHPVWSQDAANAANSTISNTTLFANDDSPSSANSTVANATTTLVSYHLFKHYTLMTSTAAVNSTNATAVDAQSLFALVFVPDLSVYLLADAPATTNTSTPTGSLSQLAQDDAAPTATASTANTITSTTGSANATPAPAVQYGVDLTACGPDGAACPTSTVPVIMLAGDDMAALISSTSTSTSPSRTASPTSTSA